MLKHELRTGEAAAKKHGFQPLETFPMIGKTATKVSNDWKNERKSFQRLEK
jgi:hypothetical protein